VGLIDFQWVGFGLASTDVAHHMCAALSPDCLSYDGSKEEELLDSYHEALCSALAEFGVAQTAAEAAAQVYTREELQRGYEVGILDFFRIVVAYQWTRTKACPAVLNKNSASLGRNSYNKSLPVALWLVSTADRLLTKHQRD
jgi:hypothetical protein